MTRREIDLGSTASGGREGDKVAVWSKGGLLIPTGAKGNLLFISRHHVMHEDTETGRRGLGIGYERTVGTDAGFGIVGAVHAYARHCSRGKILQKNLRTASGQIEEVLGTRTRAIQRRLKDVDALSSKEARAILPEIGPITPDEEEETSPETEDEN